MDEKPAVNYPITVFRFGNMPLKAPSKSGGKKSAKNSTMGIMDDDFGNFDEDFNSGSFEDEDDENYDEEEDDFADDNFDDELGDE